MGHKKVDFFGKILMLFLVVIFCITWFFLLLRIDWITAKIFSMIKSIRAVLYGIVIAYLFNPIMMSSRRRILTYLTKRNYKGNKQKVSKILSIIITSVIGISVISLICFIILPNIYNTMADLLPKLPSQIEKYTHTITNKLDTNKKLYASFYRDIKRTFKVNSYKNLSVKNYDLAISFIEAWEPKDEVLKYAIHGLNSQIAFA